MRIRWLTWFPAPYWNARFRELARTPGVDFRALFLSERSPEHKWDFSDDLFAFDHEYVRSLFHNRVPLGPRRRGFPGWAFQDRDASLILPYPEIDLMLAIIGRRLTRAPTYAFTDNTTTDFRSGSRLHEISKHMAMRAVRGVLAGGPLQVEYARHYVGPRGRVHDLGNPVDNDWFTRVHERLGPKRDEIRQRLRLANFTVLYVGRLWHGKDVDILIQAFATIASRHPSHLLIAGDGPERESLEALARRTGADVRFLGFQDRLRVCDLYEASDVLVLPSRSEPWGLVVNEAMLFAKPVVVSDHVGARALLRDGHNGQVFATGDIPSLTRTLEWLIRNPSEARLMGLRDAELIARHGLPEWVERVLTALQF
ncbi:MAG: glycosyltransferase family 4 protein [Gemmatimonadota bacterium]|nr:glycosyltransferase family 4 protein [Gemmatimonadota bacterium]